MAEVVSPAEEPPIRRTVWWRDERLWQAVVQVVFVVGCCGLIYLLYRNVVTAFARQGVTLGYGWLRLPTGFNIGSTVLAHSRTSANWYSLVLGILNTLLVSALTIVLTTLLGLLIGVARVSRNLLVNRLAWLYIELFRNVPLLLIIVFVYRSTVTALPSVQEAQPQPGAIFFTNRGLFLPRPLATASTNLYFGLLVGVAALLLAGFWLLRRQRTVDGFKLAAALGALGLLLALIGWYALPTAPLRWELPVLRGFNFGGGLSLSPEFVGLVVGLTLGSAAFTADTVRAGLEQVARGQREAAQALGLSSYQTTRLVVFPQALRVIVPPMTSNYLSITKNSSLGVAIAYPELLHVSSSVINQTGRAVEMVAILMLIYLTLSLLTSLFMNWYNRRVQLKER